MVSSTTGWVQYGGGGGSSSAVSTKVTTADQGFASVTASNVSDLSFAITAGGRYHYRFIVVHKLSLATQGIGFAVNGPASNTFHGYRVSIPNGAADGVGTAWEGWGVGNADLVTSDAGPDAASGYVALIEGIVVPTNSGTLQLQAANEVATSRVTVREGSCGFSDDPVRQPSGAGGRLSAPAEGEGLVLKDDGDHPLVCPRCSDIVTWYVRPLTGEVEAWCCRCGLGVES